jgi:peptide/nickel transport system substrate-binding protein
MEEKSYWQSLQGRATSRRLGRRGVLRAGAAGSVGVGALALVGCGDDDDDDDDVTTTATETAVATSTATATAEETETAEATEEPTEEATEAPSAPEGTLHIGLATPGAAASFNFLDWPNGFLTQYRAAIGDTLLNLAKEGDAAAEVPGLAEGYELTEDGLQVTFTLREGMVFHDGSPVTAEDVKFSYEYVTTEPAVHARKTEWTAALQSVEAPDERTVVVNLNAPYPLFIGYHHIWAVAPAAAMAAGGEAFAANPIGTGPWKWVSGTPQESITLTAVEDHYRQVPSIRDWELTINTEEATRVAQLQTGELDISPIEPASIPAIEGIDGARIVPAEGSLSLLLSFMDVKVGIPDSPWNDPRVRKAASLAIDRDGIVEGILSGHALRGGSMGLPHVPGYLDLPSDEYDPDAAKALLAEAGYADGFDFDYYDQPVASGTSALAEFAQVLVANWQAIGLRPNVVSVDSATIFEIIAQKTTPGVYVQGFGLSYLDPAQFGLAVLSNGSFSWLNSPEIDAAMQPVVSGTDDEERYEAWGNVQQMVYDDTMYAQLWYQDALLAVGPNVTEWEPVPGFAYVLRTEYMKL